MNLPSLNRFGDMARIHAAETESSEKKLALGANKKSKRQKEKEAAELKAKQAELDAALAYEDFVKSFDGPSDDPSRRFVKAGSSKDAYRPSPSSSSATPQPQPPPAGAPTSAFNKARPLSEAKPRMMGMDDDDDEADDAPAPAPAPVARGKKRAMDSFLEELKRDQAHRDMRYKTQADRSGQSVAALAAAAQRSSSSHYQPSTDDDANTTNIHVHPLPAGINEQSLGHHFCRFGSVATVKIFWPREDPAAGSSSLLSGGSGARTSKPGLGGFVAMMDRRCAERALKALDGTEWLGSILRLGWGKAVPIPPRPAFASTQQPSSRGRSRSRSPRRSRHDSDDSRSRSRSPQRRRRHNRSSSAESPPPSHRSSRESSPRVWPELDSKQTEEFLLATADRVKRHGRRCEDQMKQAERNNPDFAFLFDQSLPAHHYYRMLKDRHYKPPPPLQFEDEGDAEVHSTDSEEVSEDERYRKRTVLGKLAYKRLQRLLRSLTANRENIGHLMAFCIEHAEAADQVTDLIVMSLMLPTTPIPRKLARLYALSDILANSSAPVSSAWKYRGIIENKLGPVFDHLNLVYQSFPGRIKANAFKQQIMAVVDLWETMLIFTPAVIQDFSSRLSGSATTNDIEDVEGEPIDLQEDPAASRPQEEAQDQQAKGGFKKVNTGKSADTEDVDGEAMDLDGEAIDLDGEAMETNDINGADMGQEDFDGAPMD